MWYQYIISGLYNKKRGLIFQYTPIGFNWFFNYLFQFFQFFGKWHQSIIFWKFSLHVGLLTGLLPREPFSWLCGLLGYPHKKFLLKGLIKVKRCFQCHVQVVKLGLNCKWSSFCWLGVYYCRLTHQAVSTLHATCQLPHVWWSLPNVPHRCTVKPPGQSTVFNGAYRSIFCRAIKKLTFHGCYFFYL